MQKALENLKWVEVLTILPESYLVNDVDGALERFYSNRHFNDPVKDDGELEVMIVPGQVGKTSEPGKFCEVGGVKYPVSLIYSVIVLAIEGTETLLESSTKGRSKNEALKEDMKFLDLS